MRPGRVLDIALDEGRCRRRAAVAPAYPELLDDAVWRTGLTSGAAAWAVHATVALLDRVVDHDQPMHPTRQPVPSMRQLLRFRWTMLTGQDELPALAELGRRLLTVTDDWHVAELGVYPAFAGA